MTKTKLKKEDGMSDELPGVQNAHGIQRDIEEGSRTYEKNLEKRNKINIRQSALIRKLYQEKSQRDQRFCCTKIKP